MTKILNRHFIEYNNLLHFI